MTSVQELPEFMSTFNVWFNIALPSRAGFQISLLPSSFPSKTNHNKLHCQYMERG